MKTDFRCLAVETATARCSIAACGSDAVGRREFLSARSGSQRIYAVVREVLDEAGLELNDLDCIALGCGPGGFTGLRVGAAVVQALAYGTSKPVCRVSSLATMAAGAFSQYRAPLVATCLDARMGEAYLALYAVDDQGVPGARIEDRLVDPKLFQFESQEEFCAVGPGWAAYPALGDRHTGRMTSQDFEFLPSAVDMLILARHQFEAGQTVPAEQALPNYVREKVTQ
jgi:tRNA threonylcarbamoyladenosine biosynthesis protein TsaB